MKIQCKKCFKKYDDKIGECPRCGAINDRNYCDDESTEPDKNERTLLDRFFKKYHCSFCHTAKPTENSNCPYCKNLNNLNKENERLSLESLDTDISALLKETEHMVNKKKFLNLLESKGYNIKEWQAPFSFKFGLEKSIDLLLAGVALLMIFLSTMFVSGEDTGNSLIAYLIISGIVLTVIYFMRHLFFSECLEIYKYHNEETVSFVYRKKIQNSRDGMQTILEVTSDQLKKIEIEIDNETGHCLRMILHTKEEADVSLRVVDINMRHYQRRGNFDLVLLLYTSTFNLPVFVKRLKADTEEVIGEVFKTEAINLHVYVRLGEFILEPSIDQYKAHQAYLSLVKEERYLKSGPFNQSDNMILFKAKNKEEAVSICDNDPLVLNKLIKYTLNKWDVDLENQ